MGSEFNEKLNRLLEIKKQSNAALSKLRIASSDLTLMAEAANDAAKEDRLSIATLKDLDNLGLDAIRNINMAANYTQYALREYDPNALYDPIRCEAAMPEEDGYAVVSDETGVYVKTPIAPISACHIHAREKGTTPVALTRKKYNPLLPRLVHATGLWQASGPKLVLILHVFNSQSGFRRAPDFDNFDTKNLLDCVMSHCGGDSPRNIRSLIHESVVRENMDEGTYVAVRIYDNSRTVGELENQALEHFCRMGCLTDSEK